jgi:DHA2 family multidrug resistance protein
LIGDGEAAGWFASSYIVTLTIIAVTSLVVFVVWELLTPAPAVDLRILKNLSFAAGTAIGGMLGLTLFGSLILLPFFLQNLLHYNATQSGLTLIPRSLTMVLLMPVAGMLYNRLGVYVMLPFGLILGSSAAFLMARLTLESGSLQILVPQVVQGIGFSFVFVALSTTALSTISRAKMQYATGLYNLIRQLGGSLGTAIVVALMDHRLTEVSARLAAYASIYNPTFVQRWQALRAALIAKGVDASTAGQQALALLNNVMHQQASVIAFNYVFALIGILSLACLPLVLLLRRGQRDGEAVAVVE